MAPAFPYTLYLTFYKTDISLRRTVTLGRVQKCPS